MNKNCINCINYQKVDLLGKQSWTCVGNVNYPNKCILGKSRKILKDLSEKVFIK